MRRWHMDIAAPVQLAQSVKDHYSLPWCSIECHGLIRSDSTALQVDRELHWFDKTLLMFISFPVSYEPLFCDKRILVMFHQCSIRSHCTCIDLSVIYWHVDKNIVIVAVPDQHLGPGCSLFPETVYISLQVRAGLSHAKTQGRSSLILVVCCLQ